MKTAKLFHLERFAIYGIFKIFCNIILYFIVNCKYLNICSFMLEFLRGIEITHQTIDTLVNQCERVIVMLTHGGTSASVSQCTDMYRNVCNH